MIKKILAVVILGMVGVVGVIGLTSGEILKPHTIRYGAQQVQDDGEMRERRVRVRRVIDGDTFKTEQGESVRIIEVDAPEGGECFVEEAKTALTELILGKEVYLESDVNEMDRFGRQLRYVFMNRGNQEEIFIDEWLLEKGLARYFVDTVNVKYQKRLIEAAEKAHQEKAGLWRACADQQLGDCIIKGNLDRLDKRWYHLPEFRHYEQAVVNLEKGDQWFCSEKEAIEAGFKRARE